MPTHINPTGYVAGSAEADTFIFTARPASWVTIDSNGGIDRLEVNVPTAESMSVHIFDPFNSGLFQANFTTGPYDSQVIVFDVEDVDVVGSALNDAFKLKIGATLTNLSVTFDGAAGTDHLTVDASLFDGGFNFIVDGSSVTSSFGSFTNFEKFDITTGAGNDTVTTGDENDTIFAGTGVDTISTGAGNDSISSQASGGSVDGGDGYDFYSGYFNVSSALTVGIGETVTVSNGIVVTNVEGMSIGTGSGDDQFSVSRAIGGTVSGGAGNDMLAIIGAWGTSGLQFTIQAHSGTQLNGSVGSDLEFGGFEGLLLTGGEYDDQFLISGSYVGSAISIDGGHGTDFVHIDFRAFAEATTFIVGADGSISGNRGGQFTNIESFGLAGGELGDTLVAGSGNDVLAGGGGADHLVGGAGRDDLLGESGSDTLEGGAGGDVLSGGADSDTMSGGSGNDVYRDMSEFLNGDTITDFAPGDSIVFMDATLGEFTYNLSGSTLTYSGGSLTLQGNLAGHFVVGVAEDGGVQLLLNDVRNDFNGDGRSDILWRNDNGTVTDWLANANATFASNHAVATYGLGTDWTVAGTGDFNGDGRDDVLLRHANGTVTDWLGQANGSFVSNHAAAAYALGTEWTVSGTGDFNGDGRDDILWRNEVGAMSQWLGQANGAFAYNPNAAYQLPTNWQAAATGDFNGDGRDDIMWRNEVGAMSEWLGQANGTFAYNPNAAYQLPTNWDLAATGDFNGDGRDDILWRNEVGAMSQWLANADGTFAYNPNAAYQLPTNWELATTGDFNGDGRDDILWRNEVGAMSQWLANADATFAYNPNAAYQLPTNWEVQPEDPLI